MKTGRISLRFSIRNLLFALIRIFVSVIPCTVSVLLNKFLLFSGGKYLYDEQAILDNVESSLLIVTLNHRRDYPEISCIFGLPLTEEGQTFKN